jgi:PAS domain S-box-containing protein
MSALTDEGVISLTPLASKKSPTLSSFNPEKLLPEEFLDPEPPDSSESHKDMSSPSDSGVSAVFEPADEAAEHTLTEHTEHTNSPDEPAQFDLKPPPPSVSAANGENLHDRLYSADHLNVILRDPNLNARFAHFIQNHRSYLVPVLSRYIEVQKAKSAIDYANAVAEQIPPLGSDSAPSTPAAFLDSKFESRSRRAEEKLISDALPGYITRRLVQLVTECLVKEITGNNAPIMQEMVHGLAEVYCMTDPSLPDNPIVYSSAGFYKTTQYGREYVIGRNCRFLQGPKTAQHSVSRLSQALSSGTEVCETILNYRRDGTPFINLLMIAPLYDNKGRVRYFIGCQIDITNLIEGGRGLESFQRLLAQDRAESRFGGETGKSTMKALTELGTLLSKEEMEAVRRREAEHTESGRTTPARPATARRFIGMDDPLERNLWPPAHYGPSGRLPGVYQNVGIDLDLGYGC